MGLDSDILRCNAGICLHVTAVLGALFHHWKRSRVQIYDLGSAAEICLAFATVRHCTPTQTLSTSDRHIVRTSPRKCSWSAERHMLSRHKEGKNAKAMSNKFGRVSRESQAVSLCQRIPANSGAKLWVCRIARHRHHHMGITMKGSASSSFRLFFNFSLENSLLPPHHHESM
jgi:hypothetical protein